MKRSSCSCCFVEVDMEARLGLDSTAGRGGADRRNINPDCGLGRGGGPGEANLIQSNST